MKLATERGKKSESCDGSLKEKNSNRERAVGTIRAEGWVR